MITCTNCGKDGNNGNIINGLLPGFDPKKIIGSVFKGGQLALAKTVLQSTNLLSGVAQQIASIIISIRSKIGQGVDNGLGMIGKVPVVGARIGEILGKGKDCIETNDTAVRLTISEVVTCAREPALEVVTNLACVYDDVRDINTQISSALNESNAKFPPIKLISAVPNLVKSSETRAIGKKTAIEVGRFFISIVILPPRVIACDGSNVVKNIMFKAVISFQQFATCVIKPK